MKFLTDGDVSPASNQSSLVLIQVTIRSVNFVTEFFYFLRDRGRCRNFASNCLYIMTVRHAEWGILAAVADVCGLQMPACGVDLS